MSVTQSSSPGLPTEPSVNFASALCLLYPEPRPRHDGDGQDRSSAATVPLDSPTRYSSSTHSPINTKHLDFGHHDHCEPSPSPPPSPHLPLGPRFDISASSDHRLVAARGTVVPMSASPPAPLVRHASTAVPGDDRFGQPNNRPNEPTVPMPPVQRSVTAATTGSSKPYSAFSTQTKWVVAGLGGIAAVFSPISSNIFVPAIPIIARDFNKTSEDISLAVTVRLILFGFGPAS